MKPILFCVGLGLVASLLLTPAVRFVARRLKIVDRPDAHRKLHPRETALCGGVAVLVAFAVAVLGLMAASPGWRHRLGQDTGFLIAFSVAACVICLLGLIDDSIHLRGRQKLVGQILAASILVAGGLDIERITLFGWTVELGLLAIPFSILWLVAAINALNLIDGADGLATGVGLVLSFALAAMAAVADHPIDAVLAMALVGALAGFLVYNLPPASIFLGDAGSMLIGLILGVLAIRSSLKGPATVALAAPTAIWAIPAFDVAMAILRRKLTGRSIYTTDRGHLHHCLLKRGYGRFGTIAVIGGLCGCTALSAVVSVSQKNEWLALGAVFAVGGILVTTRLFGHQECHLLLQSSKRVLHSLVPAWRRRELRPDPDVQAHLQGNQEWEELWQTLTGFADRFGLHRIQLNVQMPAMEEDYHASWQRPIQDDEQRVWHADIPLLADDKAIGRLRIVGAPCNGSVCSWMGELITGLKPFETELLQIVHDLAPTSVAPGVLKESPAGTHDAGAARR